ncbi:MAG TPA: hypothetical protein VF771_14750 [Longimicrobiaceae bacterium]
MIRHRVAVLFAVITATGCAPRTTVRTVSRTVEMTDEPPPSQVGAAEFVAAVPAFEGEGRCESIPVGGGARLVVLRFAGGGGAERNVSLRVDSAGKLVSWSDLRGDLRPGGTGAKTAVTLGFDTGRGTALNEHASGGATQGLLLARVDEMMDLPNLGTPRRMIAAVRARCMGGSGADR